MKRLAAMLALLCGGALAQEGTTERPAALPTRDVDVTYRIEAGSQVIEQRSRFTAATQRMRVDLPTPGVYSIMDYRTHVMAFVVEADRAALETANPVPAASAYIRRGQDQVAGLACTEWETRDTQRIPVLTCFTADGVMLRARTEARPLAVAVRVAYAPQEPGLFDVPAAFERVRRPPP